MFLHHLVIALLVSLLPVKIEALQQGKKNDLASQGSVVAKHARSWQEVFVDAEKSCVQIVTYSVPFDFSLPFRPGRLCEGAGSGFLVEVDQSLCVVTNYHVVAQANNIYLQHQDAWQEHIALELLGASPEADIALLGFKPGQKLLLESKLGGQQLKPLKLGDSDKMAIGDTIMVLGYPLAQPHIKYTTGILSGQEPRGDFGECFTSDVAVSPGSSGGPCLNKNGEVIALIVGGATEGQSYNFLLPISREKILFKDLSGGVVLPRFSMGYDYAEITPETLVYLGSGADSGVLITSVEGGSLADMAGVKKRDLWSAVEYDGIRMPIDCHGYIAVPWSCSKMLPSGVFGRIAYGEEFSLEIWRDGVMHVLLCTKKIIPLKGVVYKHLPFQPSPDYEVFAGCVVVEATENLILQWLSQFSAKLAEGGVSVNSVRSFMQYADLLTPAKKGFSRVVITRVFPNSTFGLNKVFEGDTGYVKAVNGRPVNTISQYRAALLESSDTGYVVLETDKGAMGVVFLADALAQEPEMAKTYGYNFSQTYCALIQQDV